MQLLSLRSDATVEQHASDDAFFDGEEGCKEGGHVDLLPSRKLILLVLD